MKKFFGFLKSENEFACLNLPFWKKPDFLLFILAMINNLAMLITYFWVSKKMDPQEAVLWVALESSIILIIGNSIIELFKKSLSALKMKKDFISIISHQLRGPLTTIKWNLEGLKRGNEMLSEKQKRYLERIILANEVLIELADNFIFLEKMEDCQDVQKEKVLANLELSGKIKEFIPLIEAKSCKIKTFFGTKKNYIFVNKDFLKIIFDNFLSNAVRYSFEKTIISVRIRQEKGSVVFSFESIGVPVKTEEEKWIFEKFYRSELARKFSPQGSGLGLYITKVLTKKMGGSLGFFSQGKKNIFWVSFPLVN